MNNSPEQIHDEMFCLNYELKTLATLVTQNKLERWLPGFTDPVTDFDHLQRYNWACDFVKDKQVLDIACGCGKGSHILSDKGNAKYVMGCDIEEETIEYASIKYKNKNLSYKVQDALSLNENSFFDIIISFETIEHIKETNLYLDSMHRALKNNGLFIVSTPIAVKEEEDISPKNPYHYKEWGFAAFQKLPSKKFKIEKIYLQLHEPKPYTRLEKIYSRFFPKKFNHLNTTIQEFRHQVAEKKLGKQINGYEILICSKLS